jgi:hypothetical protein
MIMNFLNDPREIEKLLIEYEITYLKTGKKFLSNEEFDFLYKRMVKLYSENKKVNYNIINDEEIQ